MSDTEDVKETMRRRKKKAAPSFEHGLSTGSTLLNLACAGRPGVGLLPGKYYFLVGDSRSGKTWLSLSGLAEACLNPKFAEYRLIYDNAEDGALMDVRRFFGEALAERLEPPHRKGDAPLYSETIEEFYFNLDDAVEHGAPFIYVLDSMDALSSDGERKKFRELKVASRKAKKGEAPQVAGSYGDGKAKKNSSYMRTARNALERTGSILIVVNQTRDNIDPFSMEKKTRSGGHALRFYATLELWSSLKGKIKKTVRGKPRVVGNYVQVQLKKNRLTGQEHKVTIPIYPSYGIDDLGSCVDYLLEEKHWHKSGSNITAKELEFSGSREKLLEHIEENSLESRLKLLTTEVWQDMEAQCALKRKPRYT